VDPSNRKQGQLGRPSNQIAFGGATRQPAPSVDAPVPAGLRASAVELAGEEYIVFAFPAPEWNLPPCLTSSERQVALALLGGATNAQIAERRSTSVRTVAHQVASIFEKLSVTSRAELAFRLAARSGR
jgi:DNA-binding NarL/FixJ family response regulator